MEKVKKAFRIKWESSPYNDKYFALKIIFNRPDGVSTREIVEAIDSVNQEKLQKAFDGSGVGIFVQKGYALGNISQGYYEHVKKQLDRLKGDDE